MNFFSFVKMEECLLNFSSHEIFPVENFHTFQKKMMSGSIKNFCWIFWDLHLIFFISKNLLYAGKSENILKEIFHFKIKVVAAHHK